MELRGPVAGDRVIAQWLADDAGMLGCRPHVVLAVARPGLGACDGVRVEACGHPVVDGRRPVIGMKAVNDEGKRHQDRLQNRH